MITTFNQSKPVFTALLAFNYCAIVLHFSTAVTTFILIDRIGELNLYASRYSMVEQGYIVADTTTILRRFGLSSSWKWIVWHCMGVFNSISKR